jgi:hypothetical protein
MPCPSLPSRLDHSNYTRDGNERSASRFDYFTPRGRNVITSCAGEEWVHPRTGLDTVGKRKIPIPERN